ncbi:hypothetical protein PtrSN002B_005387 [Pyrenophora tritici-repentis]|uniref:Uncharacterized protein n=1 Tax=Pyrenophora tritici-repentis TaxID=45151 RepID=A0A2W1EUV7_9PLEO|nr:hypothetical protein PtrV1_06211 [Pyrenophora tritici-repentis]KAF7450936.1 hypothetical protein A1F99_055520 [Pyrenophora tritici-repentis]KAF7573607.1 hypothetical protein PtrM4_085120 [Pyrenophora tritici-repentis]KAI0583174.1 hypothetical protein Alg215_03718 [Pyrenophora tritici-repentis]KAI0583691.1 hypothetical protein Alg130_05550 [Pyrenophora tritici-repentis]
MLFTAPITITTWQMSLTLLFMPSNAAATIVLVSTAQNGPAARRPQPMGQRTATEYQTAAYP